MRYLKIIFLILIIVVTNRISVFANDRPQLFGFSLPYPKSIPMFSTNQQSLYFNMEKQIPITLKIDKKGKVKKIIPEKKEDSLFVKYVFNYLNNIQFEPALNHNKQVSSKLPLIIQFQPRVYTPDFYFPVNDSLIINDRDLYIKAFRVNEIEAPALISFPSFFGDLKATDSFKIYPVILFKISLDKSGKVTNIENDLSTYPAFTEQLKSAILYAKFSSAKVKGKAVPSETYLLISFFPSNNYPTKEWSLATCQSMKLIECFQVRIFPAKVALLSKPIPKRVPATTYSSNLLPLYVGEEGSVFINIDTLGIPFIRHISKFNNLAKGKVKQFIRRMRFFPALDYQSKPQPFSGLIKISLLNDEYIRVEYIWLNSNP